MTTETEIAFTLGVWVGVALITGYVLVVRWLDKRKL